MASFRSTGVTSSRKKKKSRSSSRSSRSRSSRSRSSSSRKTQSGSSSPNTRFASEKAKKQFEASQRGESEAQRSRRSSSRDSSNRSSSSKISRSKISGGNDVNVIDVSKPVGTSGNLSRERELELRETHGKNLAAERDRNLTSEQKRDRLKQIEKREKAAGDNGDFKTWANALDVFKISLPLTEGRIEAPNIQNDIVKYGLELAANNPITTAIAGALTIGVVHAGVGAFATAGATSAKITTAARLGSPAGKAAIDFGATRATSVIAATGATNAVTTKLAGASLAKAGFTTAAAIYIAKEVADSYIFAKFQIAEAMDKIGYAKSKAVAEGRLDLVEGLNQLQQEITNPEGWAKLVSLIPWANSFAASRNNVEAALYTSKIWDKIISDKANGQANGQTSSELRLQNKEEENQMYLDTTQASLEMQQMYNEYERLAQEQQRNADAAFWARQRDLEREKEKADRESIAQFWEDYRRTQQLISEVNRPSSQLWDSGKSNLNFGLL
jgi:flagellar biosynthesis regulator FlaF|tara:strand:+ start:4200 stop:5699 length:1500 start_codon:yes stop_codon:yes gene_type:complete